MKLYCVQFNIAWEDKPANHAKVRRMIEAARPTRGSLVLLTEMFSTGFSMDVARTTDGETREDQRFVASLAREHGIHIIAGITTSTPGSKGLNQAIVIDPAGNEVTRYTKFHPFGKESQHFAAGSEIVQLAWSDLRVCPFICYDLRFPELFRRGVRDGAEMFAVIANWPSARVEHWITLLRARAIENQAYVAAVNRCGDDPHLPYPGRSMIIDPQGNILADAGSDERIIEAEIDPDAARRWRSEFPAIGDMRGDL